MNKPWIERFALLGLGVEIVAVSCVWAQRPDDRSATWIYALFAFLVVAVGGLISTIAFICRPSSRRAQLWFAPHALALASVAVMWSLR